MLHIKEGVPLELLLYFLPTTIKDIDYILSRAPSPLIAKTNVLKSLSSYTKKSVKKTQIFTFTRTSATEVKTVTKNGVPEVHRRKLSAIAIVYNPKNIIFFKK